MSRSGLEMCSAWAVNCDTCQRLFGRSQARSCFEAGPRHQQRRRCPDRRSRDMSQISRRDGPGGFWACIRSSAASFRSRTVVPSSGYRAMPAEKAKGTRPPS